MNTQNPARDNNTHVLRLAELNQSEPTRFDVTFGPADLSDAQEVLGLLKLSKMRFRGTLGPVGSSDWELKADVGASVVQPCVISLAPVKTRIDEKVYRLFRKDMPEFDDGSVSEMVLEDFEEPITPDVDLLSLAVEAVALALPAYPKAEGAALENAQFADKDVVPMTDDDTKPFASLAALKDNPRKE